MKITLNLPVDQAMDWARGSASQLTQEWKENRIQFLIKFLTCILIMGLAFWCYRIHYQFTLYGNLTSDSVIGALIGWDIFHGDFFGRAWAMNQVTYWGIDVFFFALVTLFKGLTLKSVATTATLIYTLLAFSTFWLIKGDKKIKHSLLGMCIAFVFLFCGPVSISNNPTFHFGTALYLIWVLLALNSISKNGFRLLNTTCFCIFMFFGLIGDWTMLFFGFLPIIMVLFMHNWEKEKNKQKKLLLVLISVGLGALLFQKLISPCNVIKRGTSLIVSPKMLFSHIIFLFKYITILFGLNIIVVRQTFTSLYYNIPRILLVFSIFIIAAFECKNIFYNSQFFIKGDGKGNLINKILALIFLVNITTLIIYCNSGNDSRYLLFGFYSGLILLGRYINQYVVKKPFKLASLSIILFVLVSLFVNKDFYIINKDREVHLQQTEVAQWLVNNGFQNGYAPYWDSHITTLILDAKVRVSPVYFLDGKLSPRPELRSKNMYKKPANFLIVSNRCEEGSEGLYKNEELDTLLSYVLGKPKQVQSFLYHTVYIYDKDITPLLHER